MAKLKWTKLLRAALFDVPLIVEAWPAAKARLEQLAQNDPVLAPFYALLDDLYRSVVKRK